MRPAEILEPTMPASRGQLITATQLKAARMLLEWTQRDLAGACGIPVSQIKRMERPGGIETAISRTYSKVVTTLEAQGIEFIENGVGGGVYLKK